MYHISSIRNKKESRGVRGFTLIEMIVSMFIFSIVMVIATGALVSILGANRKAQAVKTVMNNLNFTLDSMTRAIRVGTNYECINTMKCYENGTTEFRFIDTNGRQVTYRFNANTSQIERKIDTGSFLALTSPSITVERLMFYLIGESSTDDLQPRVLVVVGGVAGEEKSQTRFDLQTLISQRILDR